MWEKQSALSVAWHGMWVEAARKSAPYLDHTSSGCVVAINYFACVPCASAASGGFPPFGARGILTVRSRQQPGLNRAAFSHFSAAAMERLTRCSQKTNHSRRKHFAPSSKHRHGKTHCGSSRGLSKNDRIRVDASVSSSSERLQDGLCWRSESEQRGDSQAGSADTPGAAELKSWRLVLLWRLACQTAVHRIGVRDLFCSLV